jgi:sugar lactone lactonase YvrE
MKAEVLVPCADRLGEGVLWDGGSLRWIDLLDPKLHRWRDGRHEMVVLAAEAPLGAILRGPAGGLWLVHRAGISPLTEAGVIGPVWLDPERLRDGVALNDAKVAPDGALWFGSYDLNERDPRGALWRLPPDGRQEMVDCGFTVSNGPAFAADGTVYFNDSMGLQTLVYRQGKGGRYQRDTLVTHGFPPDGLTVDAEGMLWIALYGGAAVTRHAPDGRQVGRVALPCRNVTSCAFGGPGMTTLFVTTAREGVDPVTEPQAGHLFAVATGTVGVAEPAFLPTR